MTKTLYYIECTCVKDCSYPNIDFHVGDVFYYNKNAASNEMYLYYSHKEKRHRTKEEEEHIAKTFGKYESYIPFTRQKRFAKKWQKKEYPQSYARIINEKGEFKAEIKEIKITYYEEE